MLCLPGMTKTSEILGPGYTDVVAAGLRALGVENFVLVIHDQSFPSDPDEDTGRGSPYSRGAHRLLELARALGFNGIQFGPQGQTSRVNPSRRWPLNKGMSMATPSHPKKKLSLTTHGRF